MNIFLKLRKESGLKQNVVAEKLNVKHNTVSNWERGISLPDYPTLVRIADLYEVSVDYLLGREDELGIVNIQKEERPFKKTALAEKLKELRLEFGKTQQSLSNDLGVEKYIVSNWEQARSIPSADDLIKIADVFDISLDELLGRETDYVGTALKTSPTAERRLSEQEERLLKSFNQLDERSKMRLIEDAEYFAKKQVKV